MNEKPATETSAKVVFVAGVLALGWALAYLSLYLFGT